MLFNYFIPIFIIVIGFFLALYNLKIGILWYVICATFGTKIVHINPYINPLAGLSFIFLFVFFIERIIRKNKVIIPPKSILYLLLLFYIFYIISFLKSPLPEYSIKTIINLSTRIFYFFLLLNIFSKYKDYEKIIYIFIIYGITNLFILLILKLIGINLNEFGDYSIYGVRYTGLENDPNFLSVNYFSIMPYAFLYYMKKRKIFIRLIMFIYILGGIWICIGTKSNSAVFLYFLSILISLIFFININLKYIYIPLSIFLIILILWPYISNTGIFSRIENEFIFNKKGRSIDYRIDKWDYGLSLFKNNILWGIGPELFVVMFPHHSYLHNSFLDVLVEGGVLAFISLILLLLNIFICIIKNIKIGYEDRNKAILAFLLVILTGFTSLSGAFVRSMYLWIGFNIALFLMRNR